MRSGLLTLLVTHPTGCIKECGQIARPNAAVWRMRGRIAVVVVS